jgi:NADPH-dependent 2,4-dienoyl-CoA reductase/sulfur reductase-like enzyme
MKTKYIVIGGVAAGMSAASRIKKLDKDSEVLVLEQGDFISYSACSMPYFISNSSVSYSDLIVLTPERAKNSRGIEVKTGKRVVKISPTQKNILYVDTSSGKEWKEEYDRLVIATGASAVLPPIEGVDNKNVFLLRKLSDGIKLKQFLNNENVNNVAIIGGGLVGLEMCESFHSLGKNVTLIEAEQSLLKNYNKRIVEVVNNKLTEKGISVLTGKAVSKITSTNIMIENEKIPAHVVLCATGIKPNSAIAKEAGIETGVKDAIAVDRRMETSVSGIYAAGDCAESLNLIVNKKTYVPLGTVANKQGRVAGINAAKGYAVFKGILGSMEFKLFDLEIARTGLSAVDAEMYGFDVVEVGITAPSTAHGYPQRTSIEVVMTAEKRTGKLLGAQMVGKIGVAQRINTVATAIYNEMSVDDFSMLDFAYAPPFSPVWDPLLVAANVLKGKL